VFRIQDGIELPIPATASVLPNAKLVFRPQDVSLDGSPTAGVRLPGVILHREFLGSSVRYGIRVGKTEIVVDAPFTAGNVLHEAGRPTTVNLTPHAAFWLAS
jgi:iron(III) transport system ATP-binding protein